MNENRKPLVSVIMAAYNAEAYIEEAISSVIRQTVSDWELIVLDDGSSDHTFEIMERLGKTDSRIQVLKNARNMGVARTRNAGIDRCSGKYVAFLDSDDIWNPDKLEKQVALAESTGAGIVYCSYGIVDAEGNKNKEDYVVPPETDFERLLRENVVLCSAMMVRAEILNTIRFNPQYYHEDFVLMLDMLKAGHRAVGYTDVLMRWRYIDHSRSFNKRKAAGNRWRVYREYLKLPLMKSIAVMVGYALAGFRKYR